jgi:hypothetical protein
VYQVAIDVKKAGAVVLHVHEVTLPNLVEKRTRLLHGAGFLNSVSAEDQVRLAASGFVG